MICEWWQFHGKPALPKNILPPFGVVAEDDIPHAAGWLYRDVGGLINLVAWLTIRPNFGKEGVKAANMILDFFEKESSGAIVMSYLPIGSGMSRLVKKRGWFGVAKIPHSLHAKNMEAHHGN